MGGGEAEGWGPVGGEAGLLLARDGVHDPHPARRAAPRLQLQRGPGPRLLLLLAAGDQVAAHRAAAARLLVSHHNPRQVGRLHG